MLDKLQVTGASSGSPVPDLYGVPAILPLGAVIGFPFIWQLLCNTQTGEDLAGSHHIFPPRKPPPPPEPVRPRQGKHAAEKEKPNVPNEHTETHWLLQILLTLEGNIKKWFIWEIERDICIVLTAHQWTSFVWDCFPYTVYPASPRKVCPCYVKTVSIWQGTQIMQWFHQQELGVTGSA